ncbi:hypothetical protein ACLOJK_002060 [Asimina triloba]
MADWGAVLIGVLLFVLLSPGVLFQLPGTQRVLDFGGFHTNAKAIIVHSLIFFALFTILVMAVGFHVYFGKNG